jgi:hypothetical protein
LTFWFITRRVIMTVPSSSLVLDVGQIDQSVGDSKSGCGFAGSDGTGDAAARVTSGSGAHHPHRPRARGTISLGDAGHQGVCAEMALPRRGH